jgi:rubrerythrin
MSPRQALAIALHAEQRAQAFFEHAYWSAADPAVRALAKEMAAEESEHVALVARELAATPEPGLHSTLIFEK